MEKSQGQVTPSVKADWPWVQLHALQWAQGTKMGWDQFLNMIQKRQEESREPDRPS